MSSKSNILPSQLIPGKLIDLALNNINNCNRYYASLKAKYNAILNHGTQQRQNNNYQHLSKV